MILISELQDYVDQKKNELAAVNYSKLVVQESELVKFLDKVGKRDNQLLIAVIPDARSTGKNEDAVKMNNAVSFMFLEKVDYSATDRYNDWLNVFGETQATAIEFTRTILREIYDGPCSFNRFLDWNNIEINPVSGLASCNGWSVECYFDIPF